MKVCVWFCSIGSSSGDQVLFTEGKVLVGLGYRQEEEDLVETTFGSMYKDTEFLPDDWMIEKFGADRKCYVYNDNIKGDGVTAVFIDI